MVHQKPGSAGQGLLNLEREGKSLLLGNVGHQALQVRKKGLVSFVQLQIHHYSQPIKLSNQTYIDWNSSTASLTI